MLKISKIILILVIIISSVLTVYLINRFSFSTKQEYYRHAKESENSILTIGIIGDSWVAGHKLDSLMHFQLLDKGFPNTIYSSGQPGAKSKLIYENLFKDPSLENSSKNVITQKPDYVIVIAGVNDAAGQVGKNYYQHHLSLIIDFLIYQNIKPIIVSLPEFEVEKVIANMDFLSETRNRLSAYFNNEGEVDNVLTYRTNLENFLIDQNLMEKIIWIDFDNLCKEFYECKDLYRDYAHLSNKGNFRLVELINEKLIFDLNH